MPVTFAKYLEQLVDTITRREGNELAFLLRPSSPHASPLADEFRNPTPRSFARYRGFIEAPWDDVAIHYVLVAYHHSRDQFGEAYREQAALVNAFYNFFQKSDGWSLPTLLAILRDLRVLAYEADIRNQGDSSEPRMEDASRVIQRAFNLCLQDRDSPYENSRKWGVYGVVGLILKSYFRIRKISLSVPILRALGANKDLPPLSDYPKPHQVTYKYYLGMIAFLEERYAEAEKELTQAFDACYSEAHNNLQMILTYLIPLRLFRGHMPSAALLTAYPALENLYSQFLTAICKGDIESYDKALVRLERPLIDLNLYLMLEKARELCIRGLFRRVWVATSKGSQITVSFFHAALRLAGQDVDLDEAECLVAIMIARGYIKGYISHAKRTVVLSKVDAFPALTSRATPYVLY
ncbi:unnamed protein product [Peniophora sp. CBMAI 1063]|nr:unnamed protein product [Peniophora sp. CBMAI 1063]